MNLERSYYLGVIYIPNMILYIVQVGGICKDLVMSCCLGVVSIGVERSIYVTLVRNLIVLLFNQYYYYYDLVELGFTDDIMVLSSRFTY
jgi:hypothetical protein